MSRRQWECSYMIVEVTPFLRHLLMKLLAKPRKNISNCRLLFVTRGVRITWLILSFIILFMTYPCNRMSQRIQKLVTVYLLKVYFFIFFFVVILVKQSIMTYIYKGNTVVLILFTTGRRFGPFNININYPKTNTLGGFYFVLFDFFLLSSKSL